MRRKILPLLHKSFCEWIASTGYSGINYLPRSDFAWTAWQAAYKMGFEDATLQFTGRIEAITGKHNNE